MSEVPSRQSYPMAVVTHNERSAAAGVSEILSSSWTNDFSRKEFLKLPAHIGNSGREPYVMEHRLSVPRFSDTKTICSVTSVFYAECNLPLNGNEFVVSLATGYSVTIRPIQANADAPGGL